MPCSRSPPNSTKAAELAIAAPAPPPGRWREPLGLLATGIALLLLWQVPWLGWIAYPFRLFGTFTHELSHGLAAAATGGALQRFVVNPDLSGMAWSAGGIRWIVSSAGYIGSAVFGAMLVLASRVLPARGVLLFLGVSLLLVCALYVRNLFGMASGLLLGAALVVAAMYLRRGWSESLLLVLAVQSMLEGFGSLLDLFHLSRGAGVHTDAHTLAQLSGLPAPLWAVMWGVFSAVVTLGILRVAMAGSPPAVPPDPRAPR
jgi:hypothetical protein